MNLLVDSRINFINIPRQTLVDCKLLITPHVASLLCTRWFPLAVFPLSTLPATIVQTLASYLVITRLQCCLVPLLKYKKNRSRPISTQTLRPSIDTQMTRKDTMQGMTVGYEGGPLSVFTALTAVSVAGRHTTLKDDLCMRLRRLHDDHNGTVFSRHHRYWQWYTRPSCDTIQNGGAHPRPPTSILVAYSSFVVLKLLIVIIVTVVVCSIDLPLTMTIILLEVLLKPGSP